MQKKRHPRRLISTPQFVLQLLCTILIGLSLILIALLLGMIGYHYFENLSWLDSFTNAAMILSGEGPLGPLNTVSGKYFAGCYAIFSGLFFTSVVGLIFVPIAHRIFHKFTIEDDASKN